MPKVALASVYGQRGAVATADMKPGEAALSVPLASALVATTSGLSACPLPKSFVSHAYWKESSGCADHTHRTVVIGGAPSDVRGSLSPGNAIGVDT